MLLTVVGNSGSFPGPASAASSYLLTGEDAEGRVWRLVLDMGNGALGALQRHIRLPEIDAVMVSHLHPDHCVDLAGLHVAVKWDPHGWPTGRIPLYGPSQLHGYLNALQCLADSESMDTEFDFRVWAEREPVRVGPFTVTPFRVLHPCEEPYALRVDYHGPRGRCVLAYSGDADVCPGLLDAAHGADLFLCEAAYQEGREDHLRGIHLTGRRAGQSAQDAGAGRLLLTHLPVWNDPDRACDEAREVYHGPVEVSVAGQSYAVPLSPHVTTGPADDAAASPGRC